MACIILLVIALFCIPAMLCVKPCYESRKKVNHHVHQSDSQYNMLNEEDEEEEELGRTAHHDRNITVDEPIKATSASSLDLFMEEEFGHHDHEGGVVH